MVSFKTISVLTSGLFMVLTSLGVSQQLGVHDRTFYKLLNSSLVGNVKLERKVKDSLECSFLCLKHGPFVCLSFNFGKASESGYCTCELSNSERYLEPQKMQEQPSYDYYGTTTESLFHLFQLLPCSSSPCNYGGSCIPSPQKGEFSCQCGVEIAVLPFIDNKCNVDSSAMGKTTPVQGVLHAYVGRYTLNFYDAQRICEINGAKLATYNQLYAAWQDGLQNCSFGWLADGTAGYPMQEEVPGCGDRIGIIGVPTVRNKQSDNYNAWCYTE